jgi:type I restriction enzyme S subunit
MLTKNKIPIYFKDFTGKLTEKKLGVVCIIGDIDHRMPKSVLEGVPYLMTGDFLANNGLDFENCKFISIEDYEQLSRKIKPEISDILFARYASVGDVRYVEKDIKFLISYSCAIIKCNENILGRYLFYYLQSNRMKHQIEININTGSQRNIGIDSLKKLVIFIPKIDEQLKTANYFKQVDKLIEQKEKKYQKLKQLKKAMLDKMFLKNGADTPEIRFKGFIGKWEEKKLGEFAKFRRGSFPQPYGKKEWYDGESAMPFVQVVDVNSSLSLNKDTKQKISLLAQPQSVLVKKGTVVVTLQGSIGRVAILQYDAYVDRTLLIFESFETKINSVYWAYLIQKLFEQEKKKAPGGTIKTITKEALSNFTVLIPILDEQEKIGNYFQKLDKQIDLQQKEIEKLKNIKKASLDKMFV